QEAASEEASLHEAAKTRPAATAARPTSSGLTGCHSGRTHLPARLTSRMTDSTQIILHPGHSRTPARRRRADDPVGPPPASVVAAGAGAEFAWDEFFKGQLANAHTRKNYAHAVRHFLDWCDHPDRQIPLVRITPGQVVGDGAGHRHLDLGGG